MSTFLFPKPSGRSLGRGIYSILGIFKGNFRGILIFQTDDILTAGVARLQKLIGT